MKKILIAFLCITTIICFASCGSNTAVEPVEETSTQPVEETKAKVDPISEKDFILKLDDAAEEEDTLSAISGDDTNGRFYYYDPTYDESKEGVLETSRGIVLGDSKDDVKKKYGEGKAGDFDINNDYCYDFSKNVVFDDDSGETDVSTVMRAQCVSYIRYTYEDIYTISFYFNENDELSWVFFINTSRLESYS